jgi:hypothetical protein
MNAKTGIWSALGAVVGAVAGATAGHYALQYRPKIRYATEARARRVVRARRPSSQEMEDAMVIGGAVGATVGAFFGGTVMGEETPPPKQLQP